jgi:4-hydroxy-3-polyprenylbenzoate decarboxylase
MIVVGITGSSGIIYAVRLLQQILNQEPVTLILTQKAKLVMQYELGIAYKDKSDLSDYLNPNQLENLHEESNNNMMAASASGSASVKACIIVPCSMNSLAAVYAGLADTLLLRTADVTLKEGRPLYLVPREMPFSTLHLRNMYELSQMGVRILPASPGFYHMPETMDDLINFVVAKILDQLGIPHTLVKPWDGNQDGIN